MASSATKWATTAAVAKYLGTTQKTVRHWIRRGSLRGCQVQTRHYSDERDRKTRRGGWRIYAADLERFLIAFRGGPVAMPRGIWHEGP